MNKPVMITSDSTCDLPEELKERFGIRTVPLHVHLGDDDYLDGVSFTQDMIFETYARDKLLPTTSAVTPQEFEVFFRSILAEGYEIVHVSLSADISGTVQNSIIASQELEGVYTVDSRSVTSAMGMMLFEASRLRDEGLSAAEIAQAMRELTPKVNLSFILDTLEFMWKGGRCTGVAAFGANLLKLKPLIEMADGKLEVCKKYRGGISKVTDTYLKERLTGRKIRTDYGIIVSTVPFTPEEQAHLRELVCGIVPFKELFFTRTGCTISTHAGPGAMGVAFLEE